LLLVNHIGYITTLIVLLIIAIVTGLLLTAFTIVILRYSFIAYCIAIAGLPLLSYAYRLIAGLHYILLQHCSIDIFTLPLAHYIIGPALHCYCYRFTA
jgi:hypothetical protein